MSDFILNTNGTRFVFADHLSSGFTPSTTQDWAVGTTTNVQLAMASVADGAARESAKFDFGVDRAVAYRVDAVFEFAATPTSGTAVELGFAGSPIITAANANPMGMLGVDGSVPSGVGTIAEVMKAIDFIGNFRVGAIATPSLQSGFVGILVPSEQYGMLVVKNESGAAMHSADTKMHVVLSPLLYATSP